MSQKPANQVAPVTAPEISPEWLAERRAIVRRDGHAMRAATRLIAGRIHPVIEVQSINEPDLWLTLNLPGNTALFATAEDRDSVLAALEGG